MGYDSDVKGYDRRKSDPSNELFHMKQDTTSPVQSNSPITL